MLDEPPLIVSRHAAESLACDVLVASVVDAVAPRFALLGPACAFARFSTLSFPETLRRRPVGPRGRRSCEPLAKHGLFTRQARDFDSGEIPEPHAVLPFAALGQDRRADRERDRTPSGQPCAVGQNLAGSPHADGNDGTSCFNGCLERPGSKWQQPRRPKEGALREEEKRGAVAENGRSACSSSRALGRIDPLDGRVARPPDDRPDEWIGGKPGLGDKAKLHGKGCEENTRVHVTAVVHGQDHRGRSVEILEPLDPHDAARERQYQATVALCESVCGVSPRCHTDRKSTRLNSSHHSISYAVFC